MDPEREHGWVWAGEAGTAKYAPLVERQKTRRRARQQDGKPDELLPYQIVLQGSPINLDPVEYLIVTFLAARPYHAFKPEDIVRHVNEKEELIQPDELSQTIVSLRSKMGFFRDYVQSVPYIGYRFKP
jgi:DNA-binding response OmpR family regulator